MASSNIPVFISYMNALVRVWLIPEHMNREIILMKSFNNFQTFIILLLLSSINLPALSQGSDYPISSNQLIVGDTTILRREVYKEVGNYDPERLWGRLNPFYLYYPEYCPDCREDTLLSFRTELVQDSTFDFYFAVPFGTLTGRYDLFYMYEGNPVNYYSVWIDVYTPPYILLQPRDTTVCAGEEARFSVTAWGNDDHDLTYEWYHNDTKIGGISESVYIIENAHSNDTGAYYCVLSNQYGVDTTQIVRLDLHPYPSNPGTPVGLNSFCPGIDSTVYSVSSDPLATGYSWHLIPEEAGIIQQQDTLSVIFWDPAFSGMAKLYVELISGNCGRNTSDTLEITVPGISAAPEICIIGIDEQTGKYRITWEKSAYGSAKLFRIYRESNQADVYLEIGTVDTSKISYFVDSSSVPNVLSHRYKISYTDSCGNESELSGYHQTMHLVANIGTNGAVNLIWSEYKGIPFPAYTIYRGNHPDSMSLLIQVPSTVTSFTDIDPPLGNVYYQIGMSNPAGCDPVKKSDSDYSSSRSNMEQVKVTGIQELNENNLFSIYPNPVVEVLQIRYRNAVSSPVQFIIYNSLGAIALEGFIRVESTSVDVSSLSQGMYILQLSTDTEASSARFLINRKKY